MKTPMLYCADGSELELPYKWVICDHCRGEGKSSAYLGAFTGDQMAEMDQDWIDDYVRGRFDRACDHCAGLGRVKVADLKAMSKGQRRDYLKQEREAAECDAIHRQEMLFEGGWRDMEAYGAGQ